MSYPLGTPHDSSGLQRWPAGTPGVGMPNRTAIPNGVNNIRPNSNIQPMQYRQPLTGMPTTNISSSNVPRSSPGLPSTVKVAPNKTNTTAINIQEQESQIITAQKLQALCKQIDQYKQLDNEAVEVLMRVADEFLDQVTNNSCSLARHRGSKTLEVKDIKLCLERDFGIKIPGYDDSNKPPNAQRTSNDDIHQKRLSLIRRAKR
eukprot:TRINITY_DN7483_c0_g1_i3.p1 TRINITY_DN7483_c0_g1~~TRINITY_DN7483_c0_g1_i3.p1  ORF type:complete len:204 (+),score=33.99 TRINITY_DN7483_c0_g1_i3:48-659(+)